MNINSEYEMKIEELNLEHDFSEQSFQICPNNERNFALPDNIKKEELDQESSIKTEMREPNFEFVCVEEFVNNEMIGSDIPMMIAEKSSGKQEFMSLRSVSSLLRKINEKGSEVYFESDEEEFFAQLVSSKFPLVLLRKWSDEEIKIILDGGCEKENGSKVLSTFRSRCQMNNKIHSMNPMLTHEEKEIFKCSECSYTSSRKECLQLHMNTHKHIKLLKCSSCTYTCNRKIDLDNHVLVHSCRKFFKCPHCTYRCKTKDSIKLHMLTHTENLFKCSVCQHESNHEEHFKMHMLSHQNKKLYKCSECNFETNFKASLTSHELRRHKKRIYKCSESNNIDDDETNFWKVRKIRNANAIFKCPKCSYETNLPCVLGKHMAWHKKNTKLQFNSYSFAKKRLGLSGKGKN